MKQEDPIEGHEYDGIRELNNPAPFWWQLFFYLSIAFGVGYYTYYELLGGSSSTDELRVQLEQVERLRLSAAPAGIEESQFATARSDANQMKLGATAFAAKCASCHAEDGGGGIGPNLADRYWIHGKGRLMDIYQVIKVGVAEKGMPPWDAVLTRDEMIQIVAYVDSLKGTQPKAPKAPQGEPQTN